MGAFSLLASRLPCPLFLVPDFSLLASVKARQSSLEMSEAGRTCLPGLSFSLPRYKRELSVVTPLRASPVFAAWNDHMPRRGKFALEAVNSRRECATQVIIAGASEVHCQGTEVDDRLVLTECRQPEETREIAIGDCWCGDYSRGDSLAVIMFQGDKQFTIKWR